VKVKAYGLRSFIVEDGILTVFCHIEKKMLFVDRIEIHGTIEITELAILLRKIKQFFRNNYGVNY